VGDEVELELVVFWLASRQSEVHGDLEETWSARVGLERKRSVNRELRRVEAMMSAGSGW
jgi:hypothetical protein